MTELNPQTFMVTDRWQPIEIPRDPMRFASIGSPTVTVPSKEERLRKALKLADAAHKARHKGVALDFVVEAIRELALAGLEE